MDTARQHFAPATVIESLARLRVPRYTSYPTAVAFSEAVDVDTYTGWLSALAPRTPVSLYTHIPFCQSLCHYCGCHMTVANRREPVAHYIAHVVNEIQAVARHVPTGLPVHHLHFGGGTPSLLQPEDLTEIMTAFEAAFDLSYPGENAMELDPRTVSPDLVEAMSGWGFNRVSLGVQDIQPAVQQAINRHQPFACVEDAVTLLRTAGIAQINMDLVYGLPLQTVASVRETAQTLLALSPDRLAVFGYAHVPWMKSHQRVLEQYGLPSALERFEQAQAIHETVLAAGYVAIGIDHYAKGDDPLSVALSEGRLRRNFQGYTDDSTPVLLGFGASSIGYLPNGYVQNAPRIDTYGHGTETGLVTARGLAFKGDDLVIAAAIERVMCDLSVDLEAIAARFHVSVDQVFAHVPEAYSYVQSFGCVELSGWRVSVPESARLFTRIAAGVLDPGLNWQDLLHPEEAVARHSVAV